jgi:hypothetical protein
MAGQHQPGPTGQSAVAQNIDDGTLARTASPAPGPLALCTATGPSDFSWGYGDVVVWKVLPKWLGGDPDRLRNYKDRWVRDHRAAIKRLSLQYNLPPELLAGVAWIETGGKPYTSKLDLYRLRRFDHSGDPLLEPMTITKKPGFTSMGPVAIQLRRAAETMGVDFDRLNEKEKSELVDCLQNADNDLAIVARHLWQLKQIDFPDPLPVGPLEIQIIGARYNRGRELSLQQIRLNTSYGDFIVKFIPRLRALLAE